MRDMNDTATTDFVETLGIIFQNEGLPRIAGRLLGFLIVTDGSRSFSDLVDALQVSKGSVSTNTRLLENLGAIERTSKPGDRQDYFRLAHAPYEQLLERSIERAGRARETLQRESQRFPKSAVQTKQRISDLIFFYDVVVSATEDAARKLRNRRKKRSA